MLYWPEHLYKLWIFGIEFVSWCRFAAEIFHDLHDDIMAVVARGRNLKARVARLEADLPAVEKALLAESSQFNFAYSGRRLQQPCIS